MVEEANFSHTVLYVDDQIYAMLTNTSVWLSLSEGNHSLLIAVYDRAGNVARASTWMVVDITPPLLEVLSPANGTTVFADAVVVQWHVEDTLSGVARVWLRLDEGTWIDVSNATTYVLAGLEVGEHTIDLSVVDRAGNVASVRVCITVTSEERPVFTYVVAGVLVGAGLAVGLLLLKRRRKARPSQTAQ